MSRVIRAIVALLTGVALYPVLLVFWPGYFPWTLLIVATAGLVTGLAGGGADLRAQLVESAVAGVVLMVGAIVVLAGLATTRSPLELLASSWWLIVPISAGVAAGASARHRFGSSDAAVLSATGVGAIALLGAVLAYAAAPAQVANVPACDPGQECPLSACWMTAERRRLYVVERVTRYENGAITCVYTGWGGVHIGTVTAAPGAGSGWEDGWWPRLISGRTAPRRSRTTSSPGRPR
jgi:hypothetical protein